MSQRAHKRDRGESVRDLAELGQLVNTGHASQPNQRFDKRQRKDSNVKESKQPGDGKTAFKAMTVNSAWDAPATERLVLVANRPEHIELKVDNQFVGFLAQTIGANSADDLVNDLKQQATVSPELTSALYNLSWVRLSELLVKIQFGDLSRNGQLMQVADAVMISHFGDEYSPKTETFKTAARSEAFAIAEFHRLVNETEGFTGKSLQLTYETPKG